VAPVLQFFGAGQGYLADRFTYVPYFGLFAIVAWYYQQQEKNRLVWNVALGLFLVAAAYQTVRQIGVWKNGETLWTHVMKYEYDEKTQKYTNSLPFWNRGQYRRKQGDYERALSDYTQAVSIDPKNPELFNSRGKTYFDMAAGGKLSPQKASEYLQRALEDYNSSVELAVNKPQTQAEAYVNRGAAYGMSGQYDKALSDLNKGVAINPDNKNAYFNRSIVYFNTGQYDAAIGDYSKYLEYSPYDANILYERGMLRRAMKKPSEAIPDLTRAIAIKPDFGLAYLERARANAMLGNKSAAQGDYQRASQFGNKMQEMDYQLMAQ
jgi:tetratricopeptide (TPR) repeat protein